MTHRPIKNYMTALTQFVDPAQSLSDADHLMRKYEVRHLPVLDGGKLVGIVSQTDLHLIETLDGVEPDLVAIGSAMTPLPYRVPLEEELEQVARTMSDHRYGCAIVVDGESVIGIFTVTDAVRVLAEFLSRS